ncbi:MAG: helix-turn-helix domain-containing protein [Planctomyces sp.]|jgi:transcriptional regulator with XRE-family HTH domain
MDNSKSDEAVAFGHAVRESRKSLGLSQADFAEISQLHRTYVGGVERGERNPTLSTIWRLANALKMPPEELIGRARSILAERRQT